MLGRSLRLDRARRSARNAADLVLRHRLERLHASGPVLVPEYYLRVRPRWGWGRPELSEVARRLEARSSQYEQMLDDVCSMQSWARTIPRDPTPGQPCWNNVWWSGVDALALCAALRRRGPASYVEIGSGFSTLFARRAIEDFNLSTRIVSIDPKPRADVERSCDEALRAPLEDVDLTVFDRLTRGDIIVVDGSHTALMNSDSTVFLLEVLPRLSAGVLIGIHDVFLPSDYPPDWVGRMYGEQYLLAAMLLGGAERFNVRFPGWWFLQSSPLAGRLEPVWPTIEGPFGRVASAFWIETA